MKHIDFMPEAMFLRHVANELTAVIRHDDTMVQESIVRLRRMADIQDRMTAALAKGEAAGWDRDRMFEEMERAQRGDEPTLRVVKP